MVRWVGGVAVAALAPVALAACGGGGDRPADRPVGLTVFAAASLAQPFTELAAAFEADRSDVSVTLNVAGSSELVTQVDEGAPADVVASADEVTMARLEEAVGTRGGPVVFATNRMAILVERGNPLGIDGVDDLADSDVVLVTASPEVPVGRYAEAVFAAAGVDPSPRSLEPSAQGVVTKVVLGEADAGVVYATDVLAAGDRADGVAIPHDLNVEARYPIAVPVGAPHPDTAADFVDFVLSSRGRSILDAYRFAAP